MIFRLFYLAGVGVFSGLNRIRLGFIGSMLRKTQSILPDVLLRSRFPIAFIILGCVIKLPMEGELIFDPIASGLYFAIGYSLYENTALFKFLKGYRSYYFLVGLAGFTLYMILGSKNLVTEITSASLTGEDYLRAGSEPFALVAVFFKTICAILFSYSFIGLAESRFGFYNPKLRFISDGSYWMYLIHLPIVTTSIIWLATYKYFVKSTLVGILLNGRRIS